MKPSLKHASTLSTLLSAVQIRLNQSLDFHEVLLEMFGM